MPSLTVALRGVVSFAVFGLLASCGIFHSNVRPVSGGIVADLGKLQVVGRQLCDARGRPVQLRGVSFFWVNWHEENLKPSAARFMARQMGATVIRIPVPAFDYANAPSMYDAQMRAMVGWARDQGIYALIDWHVVDDPAKYLPEALEFWRRNSRFFAGDPHVLYEISNEPTSVGWEDIREYARSVIAEIRRHDTATVIVVGTPEWSRRTSHVLTAPLADDADGRPVRDVMYTYHGYAGSHGMARDLDGVLQKIPVFVTEWGVSEASGDGFQDWEKSREFVDFLAGNPWQKVSWVQWSWVDKRESSALLQPGSGGLVWQLSAAGDSCARWIREPGRTVFEDFSPAEP